MKTRIKKSLICADIKNYKIDESRIDFYTPQVGDVAIFEVLEIGKHTKIQTADKRHSTLMPGDLIMLAFGSRYATGQFEGYVPTAPQRDFHILGGGGTVGWVHSMHTKFLEIGPTTLRIIGYAVDRNREVVNTKQMKANQLCEFSGTTAPMTNVILSVGSSMDSGKTTTAAYLTHGLKKQGKKVGYIKLTGTVYSKDTDLAYDLGADAVFDFSYLGFPSTYQCEEQELLNLYASLMRMAGAQQLDHVIIEIADGIFQRETKMLLSNQHFMRTIDKVVFSAGDSLSALQGVQILNTWGIIPAALCGMFTASPLLVKEVQANTNVPVYTLEELADGVVVFFSSISLKHAV